MKVARSPKKKRVAVSRGKKATAITRPKPSAKPARPKSGGKHVDPGYRELRKAVLLRFEIDFVWKLLKTSHGNISLAARMARIDRKHFWRLIKRTGIKVERG